MHTYMHAHTKCRMLLCIIVIPEYTSHITLHSSYSSYTWKHHPPTHITHHRNARSPHHTSLIYSYHIDISVYHTSRTSHITAMPEPPSPHTPYRHPCQHTTHHTPHTSASAHQTSLIPQVTHHSSPEGLVCSSLTPQVTRHISQPSRRHVVLHHRDDRP